MRSSRFGTLGGKGGKGGERWRGRLVEFVGKQGRLRGARGRRRGRRAGTGRGEGVLT